MAVEHGHAHAGGGHLDRGIVEDLHGLVDHLHFFLGVVVLQEDVDVRQHVEGDAVRIDLVFGLAHVEQVAGLAFQFFQALLAGTGHGLIGGDHHAADAHGVMDGLEGHQHLDGGAVGVGDDALMAFQVFGVHFGDDQGAAVVHAPLGGVVHHHTAGMGGMGSEFFGSAAAGGEDGDVDTFEDIFLQFLHHQLVIAERHLGPGGTGRGESTHFRGRELAIVQGFQHFTAHGARGAHNGNSQLLAHAQFSMQGKSKAIRGLQQHHSGPAPKET